MKLTIEQVAEKMVELERAYQETQDIKYQEAIEKLIGKLSFEQFILVDEYIQKNNLLTK